MTIRKSLAWSFSQNFGQYGVQFIGSIVIARLLTPEEVGIFALAMAASYLIASLRDFGVGSYLIREEQLNDDKIRTAFGMWLAVSWSLGLIILLVRGYVAELYDSPGISGVLVLLSVSFFVTPFGQPAQALLTREMRFDIQHHINLAVTIAGTATSITLAALGFSYMALAWGLVASTVLRSLLLIAVRPRHLTLLPGFRYWREVTHFGGFLTGASVLNSVSREGLKFILGAIMTPGAVALFDRSTQLPSYARRGLLEPLRRVLSPAYAKVVREGRSVESSFLTVISYSTVLLWPTFLTLGLLSESIVVNLFGENWRVAGEILPYILLAHSITLIMGSSNQLLVAHGKVAAIATVNAVLAALSLSLAAISSLYGIEVFAMSRPVVAVCNFAAFAWAVRAAAGIGFRKIVGSLPRSFAVAIIGSAPAILYRIFYPDDATILELVALAAASVVTWGTALYLVKHPILNELSRVIRLPGVLQRRNPSQ